MRTESVNPVSITVLSYPSEVSKIYIEGIVAGIIGAATIAVWFLILDLINGHPLHTPTLLGTALFRGGKGSPDRNTCRSRQRWS